MVEYFLNVYVPWADNYNDDVYVLIVLQYLIFFFFRYKHASYFYYCPNTRDTIIYRELIDFSYIIYVFVKLSVKYRIPAGLSEDYT